MKNWTERWQAGCDYCYADLNHRPQENDALETYDKTSQENEEMYVTSASYRIRLNLAH